jgi:Na+/H+ antiporter NhaC
MKKDFKERFWWIYIIPAVLVVLVVIGVNVWGVYDFFRTIWTSSEGVGMFILNILKIPFAIYGGIQLFRGFGAIADKDIGHLGEREYWKGVLYMLATVIGYLALISILRIR